MVPTLSLEAIHMNKLLSITCGCGFGYFTTKREWISGKEVRAGRLPPRPGMYVLVPESAEERRSLDEKSEKSEQKS